MLRLVALSTVVAVLLLLIPADASATGCRVVSQPTYHAPTYHQPTYYPPNVQILKETIQVPTIFFQWLSPAVAQIGPAQPPVTASSVEDDEALLSRLIERAVERHVRKLVVGEDDDLPAIDEPGAEPLEFSQRLLSELNQKCYSCHNPQTKKGNIVLFTGKTTFAPNVGLDAIFKAVSTCQIPPAARGDCGSPKAVPHDLILELRRLVVRP